MHQMSGSSFSTDLILYPPRNVVNLILYAVKNKSHMGVKRAPPFLSVGHGLDKYDHALGLTTDGLSFSL